MKPRTDTPSEQVMRYFTPQLYLQFNAADDDAADRAHEAWEQAQSRYRRRLDEIRRHLPPPVAEVAALDLHDAELLGLAREIPWTSRPEADEARGAVAILSVKQGNRVRSLIYTLGDSVRQFTAPEGWPFSRTRVHWLYDEIDMAAVPSGPFVHRILWSDGAAVHIPFLSVITHTVLLPEHDEGASRKIA